MAITATNPFPCYWQQQANFEFVCLICNRRASPRAKAIADRIPCSGLYTPRSSSIGGARLISARNRESSPFSYRFGDVPQFISMEQLMRDAHILATKLPADTARVIGVARSGLCVATMVAMLRHVPLEIFRQSRRDLIPAGNGWRLSQTAEHNGPTVLIDDTCMTGNSFKDVLPVVRVQYPEVISAAVYVNPSAAFKPDLWVHDLPWPHILEWNVMNSVLTPACAFDFDGILCHDCRPGDDDDGERYLQFLRTTRVLYAVRKTSIPLIVTARIEKYRQETSDWLTRHKMTAKKLIMHPATTLRERERCDIAAFKAQHFQEFMLKRHAVRPALFFESDPGQARRIAELSGGIVVCPAAKRCFAGDPSQPIRVASPVKPSR